MTRTKTRALANWPNNAVSVLDFGAIGDGVTDDTVAIQAAVNSAKYVVMPKGTYKVSSPIILTATSTNLVLKGLVATIVPTTNTIQVFSIQGANDVTFKGITFDNSANGVLQNQPKGSRDDPNNVTGNAQNTAIFVSLNNNVSVIDCHFINWQTACYQICDYRDKTISDGSVIVTDCTYKGCCFGNLINNPKNLILSNIVNADNVDSYNNDGSFDPGHCLYVTDRSSPMPDNIVIDNIQDYNGENSVLKVRKGRNLSINNVTVNGSAKGVEVWNVKTGSVSNCSITLAETPVSNRSAIELSDCGSVNVTGSSVDTRGVNAWAVRIRGDGTGSQPYSNDGITVADCKFVDGYTDASQTGKSVITISNQTNTTIKDVTFTREGTITGTRALIVADDSDHVVVDNTIVRFVDAAAKVDVVQFSSNSSDCVFTYTPDLLEPRQATPFTDTGTNNTICAQYALDEIPNGSETEPSLAFTSSPTTGFYRPSNNIIGLTMDGVLTYQFLGNRFQPATDAATKLGAAGNRWDTVYAATGAIDTSDAVTKQNVIVASTPEQKAALEIKGLIKKFKFTNAVELKGADGARWHFGVMAQDIKTVFEANGLKAEEYGLFCEDVINEETGETRLGVRYSELFAFILAAL